MGYNIPVARNALDGRWHLKPSDSEPKRFGFFEVAPVDPTARDNEYLHAVLLDYGKGGNAKLDPTAGLRDYLVQVDANNPDLYLGKAYYAVGPARLATNFFILERHRVGLTDYVRATAMIGVDHRASRSRAARVDARPAASSIAGRRA